MTTTVSADAAGTAGTRPVAPRRSRHPGAAAASLGALLCGMGSVQVGASLATRLFAIFGARDTGGLRVLFAFLLLLPLALLSGSRFSAWRRAIGAIVPYGVAMAAMNVVFYSALARLPLGIVVSIEFTGPLALALIGSRRWLDLCWVGLAVAGLLLLVQPWRAASHRLDPLGVALALAAAASWALYILFGRRLGRHLSGIAAITPGMAVAALVTLPLSLPGLAVLQARPALLPAVLGMALLSSAVPYTIEMMAMRRMSMRGFSILMSLEPAMAAIAGLLLLHQELAPERWLAIGAIMCASLGSALFDAPPPKEAVPSGGP